MKLQKTEESLKRIISFREETAERLIDLKKFISDQLEAGKECLQSANAAMQEKDFISYSAKKAEAVTHAEAVKNAEKEIMLVSNAPTISESEYVAFRQTALQELNLVLSEQKSEFAKHLKAMLDIGKQSADCIKYVNDQIRQVYLDDLRVQAPKCYTSEAEIKRFRARTAENELYHGHSIALLCDWIKRSKMTDQILQECGQ